MSSIEENESNLDTKTSGAKESFDSKTSRYIGMLPSMFRDIKLPDISKTKKGFNTLNVQFQIVVTALVLAFALFPISLWLAYRDPSGSLSLYKNIITAPLWQRISLAIYVGAFTIPFINGIKGDKAKRKILASAIEAKIANATAGKLAVINGSFIPENPEKVLVSPASKTKCVFYSFELGYWRKQTRSENVWISTAEAHAGVPSLLTDDTGYAAIDAREMAFDESASRKVGKHDAMEIKFYLLTDENEVIIPKGDTRVSNFVNHVSNLPANFDENIDAKSYGISITKVDDSLDSLKSLVGGGLYVKESCMPLNSSRYALGTVLGSAKLFLAKPVKLLYKGTSGMLFISRLNPKKASHSLFLGFILAFISGTALALVALYLIFPW